MANDKPERDLIPGLWIKKLTSTREHFKKLLSYVFNMEQDYPQWLVLSKTRMMAKNEHTGQAENYRPIAIQNSMYKVFTALLSEFIMNNVQRITLSMKSKPLGGLGAGDVQINSLLTKWYMRK